MQPVPAHIPRATQADAVGLLVGAAGVRVVAVAAGTAGLNGNAGRRVVTAVEEVAVFVHTQAQIGSGQTGIGRIRVGAGVGQTAAPGAQVLRPPHRRTDRTIHEEERHAVGPVAGRAIPGAAIAVGREGDLQPLATGKGVIGHDGTVLPPLRRRQSQGPAPHSIRRTVIAAGNIAVCRCIVGAGASRQASVVQGRPIIGINRQRKVVGDGDRAQR